jgi:hypothetical protein
MKSLLLFGLIFAFSIGAFANTKSFQCEVSTFTGSPDPMKAIMGWKYGTYSNYEAPLTVSPINISSASTTGTINLANGYEIVFDVQWQDSQVANNDVSTVKAPSIGLVARLQRTDTSGTKIIAGPFSSVATPKGNFLGATVQLQDSEVLALALQSLNKDASSAAVLKAATKLSATSIYEVDCKTDL